MKDSTRYLTTTVTAIALFVNPLSVVCSLVAYGTWKFCEHSDKQKRVRIKAATGESATNIKEKSPVEPVKSTNTDSEPADDVFDPENQVYVAQGSIDPIQQS